MAGSSRAWGCAAALWLLVGGALPGTAWAQGKMTSHAGHGQELFERVWQPGKDAVAGGDGLGPLFNERSCIACHHLGGIGGAGPNSNNVTLVTAVIPDAVPDKGLFQARLSALHPGFADSTSIVLHHFSTDPAAYAAFRENLVGPDPRGGNPFRQAAAARVIVCKENAGPTKTLEVDGTTLLLSERSTTPLFGLGLIDSISRAEIEAVAAVETDENPRVHGRFVGRFGWRGQLTALRDFIRGACATELGLQVSTDAQAIDPLAATGPQPARKELDLTDGQCDEMTSFVARLPAPRRLRPVHHEEAATVNSGEQVFRSVGCAVCHRPALGKVKGIYSDLLVHAMGSKLSDPMPAPLSPPVVVPSVVVPSVVVPSVPGVSAYYGGGALTVLAKPPVDMYTRLQEWKTPPLWGLRDSGPYLHDGRAQTVAEAIALHAGEASDSVERYNALTTTARDSLLAFLDTLAAPDPSSLPKLKGTNEHPPVPARPRKPRQLAARQ